MGFYRGPHIVTDGLIMYLDAGNTKSYSGTGANWYDRGANLNAGVVHDATLVNGPTFDSVNKGSIAFNGTSNYVSIGQNSLSSPNISMIFWIKGDYSNYYLGVLDRIPGTSAGLNVPIPHNGWIQVGYISGGSVNYFVINGTRYISNAFGRYSYDFATDRPLYSAADTLFGGPSSPNFAFSLQAGIASNFTTPYVWSDRNNRLLCRSQSGSGASKYFNGNMSNVAIYNRTLSESEVKQNYDALKSRYGL